MKRKAASKPTIAPDTSATIRPSEGAARAGKPVATAGPGTMMPALQPDDAPLIIVRPVKPGSDLVAPDPGPGGLPGAPGLIQ